MRTQEEIYAALLSTVVGYKERVIVLLRSKGTATLAADKFRDHMAENLYADKLRATGTNPDFVKLTTGAWVFFIACEDLEPDDEVGHPDLVLWPTEGGDYAFVKHREWKQIRANQSSPWRPIAVAPAEPEAEGSVWDRLQGKDEIG